MEEINHEVYMKCALAEALKAYEINEVPIGAVIVYKDQIIGRGYNRRNIDKNPLAHGEMIAIKKASEYMKDWRLEECTMYITLEPCPMCAGAIVQSRIPKIVLGAKNYKSGSGGTLINILNQAQFNHQVEIIEDVMVEACKEIIQRFFKELRDSKKNDN